MKQVNQITDWLMKDYVEGNIPETMMRQWTKQLVSLHYEDFLKEFEEKEEVGG